jgi:NADPH:quinone reductase-like Zn-dependent oxidoreductase
MKAVILTTFGSPDGLQLQEVVTPTPTDHDVLIRVYATTVSAGDAELRSLHFPLVFRLPLLLYMRFFRSGPLILGQEFAGAIEAVGRSVTRFRPGDQVVGWTGLALGAYAEYLRLPEDGVLFHKPSTLTYEEAAPLAVGGLEAISFLRRGRLRRGDSAAIYGAGGSIGTFAVQIARAWGADVTAVDLAAKRDLLRALGASQALDYTREDFTDVTHSDRSYDVIFDVIGKSSFARSVRALAPHGRYLLNNAGPLRQARGRLVTARSGKRVISWAPRQARETAEDIHALTTLLETGQIRPVIDRSYPLEQIAEAHRYVDTQQKQGNVVITVAPANLSDEVSGSKTARGF